MIKVCIIGCGKQADAHVEPISLMPDCQIVGVCDREELMAMQLAERYGIKNFFTDLRAMLDTVRPDVVHVITPPASHIEIGRTCFDAGCNIFFEKPFCLNAGEAEALINIANQTGLKLTIGHNNRFSHVAVEARELVGEGYLGDGPVHMESVWGYSLDDPAFAKALLSDKNHWVRKLPGRLLHNIINHGIGRIAEYLRGDDLRVIAHGFRSPRLEEIGEKDIVDELRVIIHDNATTAYFTFSTQIKPLTRLFRIYGNKNALMFDDMHQILTKMVGTNYVSFLNQFYPPLLYGKRYLASSINNIWKFLRSDLHFDHGRRTLIKSFYSSVRNNTEPPIPYHEIILTSRIMDSIFSQIYGGQVPTERTSTQPISDSGISI